MLEQYPDSAAAPWAKLGEANALYELGQYDEAQAGYLAALAKGKRAQDGFVQWRALEGVGFTLEAQDKPGEAAERFEQLASLDNGAYKIPAQYHKARMLVASGKQGEAAELLEALLKAQRELGPEQRRHFEQIQASAETLLTSLAVELGRPRLEPQLPGGLAAPGGSGNIQQQLTPEMLEALRKQLGAQGEQGGAPENEQGGAAP